MGNPILSEQQMALVNEEKAALGQLLDAINRFDPTPPDVNVVQQAIADLNELFLLVVIGEFNSGKSSFINALLGEKVMEEGVTPTTSMIHLLRYGPTLSEHPRGDGTIERTYPADFLRDITVVDTPGTNAILRQHEALTEQFVPRSDLVLFVTSSDRPFTESERALLEKIQSWGKKIVLILNKIDLLDHAEERRRVMEFIGDNARILLGITPQIFPVSARLAQRHPPQRTEASVVNRSARPPVPEGRAPVPALRDPDPWQASGFPALAQFIFGTLDEAGRVRLKLLSPLGVAERIAVKHEGLAHERLNMLKEDLAIIENIDRQLEIHQQDMQQSFVHRLSQIDNIIYETRDRADTFFERNIRINKIWDLLRAERFRQAFEQEVVADLSERIDAAVQELIDWMIAQELKMWQGISDYLSRRRQMAEREKEIGESRTTFDYHRGALLHSVGRAARDAVSNYDRSAEAQALAAALHGAVTQVGLAAGGALIGGALVATTTIAALDVTGLAALSLGSLLAVFILPHRKRQAQTDFREKMEQLRLRLSTAMRDQFQAELTRSIERTQQAIAPYTRFTRAEHGKVTEFLHDIGRVRGELANIRRRVG